MKCRLCPNDARTGRPLCRPCRRYALARVNQPQWISAEAWLDGREQGTYAGGRGSVHGTGRGVIRNI